jgi:type III restriction enzyme
LAEPRAQAAEAVFNAVARSPHPDREILLPILRRFDGEGSTDDVTFLTRKVVVEASKSHVSHVVLDGPKGNTWEETIAGLLEDDERVAAYVKNDHLGFTIPYVWEGRAHQYVPDFLVRLVDAPDGVIRTLIVEVSGGRKSPGPTAVKATTASDQWCTAVNNHGGLGRWGYLEITTMFDAERVLGAAIDRLRADSPIADPDPSMPVPMRSH